jgi:DNA-binding NarL/FixJ family response regulator
MPLRIAMIEDRPELRVGLRRIVESQPDWRWAWEAESLHAARLNLVRPTDILLLDLCLPDGEGLDLLPAVPAETRVIVFSVLGDEANVVRAIRGGAAGYVLKDAGREEILDAIRSVIDGGAPLTPSVAAHLLRHLRREQAAPPAPVRSAAQAEAQAGLAQLTTREREVLLALARGFCYEDTGQMLGISAHTVGHHIKHIYSKLQVNSRAQAVYEAVQAGWLGGDGG